MTRADGRGSGGGAAVEARADEAEGGALRIKRVPWRERRRLYPQGKALNKGLLKQLSVWNLELRSPERILEALGLAEADLGLLRRLGHRPEGWHPFVVEPEASAETGRLAALGLVRLTRLRRRINLTDAGRFLLVLTAIDPKIKKARPAGGRNDEKK